MRGLAALTLALAIVVAGRGTARLVTFIGLYWMAGGLITLRFALAIRPRRGARLGLAAGMAALMGAELVLLRDQRSGLADPDALVVLVGVSAVLTGLLRVLGGFAAGAVASGTLLLAEGQRPRRLYAPGGSHQARHPRVPVQPATAATANRLGG